MVGGRRWRCNGKEGVEIPITIAAKNHVLGAKVLDKKRGSNSIEHELSCVSLRTEIRFRTMEGTTRTSFRWKETSGGVCREERPDQEMGMEALFMTMTREEEGRGERE